MTQVVRVALIIDPIETLHHYKDTSMVMWFTMAARGWQVDYVNHTSLYIESGRPCALARNMSEVEGSYSLAEQQDVCLSDYDLILMRQDPPFNAGFIFNVMLLRLAESQGALVANACDALLTHNEKLFAAHFPSLIPKTFVSRDMKLIDAWYKNHGDVIIKPLDGMGGQGIFHIKPDDDNASSIIETVTHGGSRLVMLQDFIPEVVKGDKRILLIDGQPFDYALARIPREHEARANLAAGGSGVSQVLSARDREIAETVGKAVGGTGLYLVGIDVIGDYLTEVNVTSPTGVKELIRDTGINPLEALFDRLQEALLAR